MKFSYLLFLAPSILADDVAPTACITSYASFKSTCADDYESFAAQTCTPECDAAVAQVQVDCTVGEPKQTAFSMLYPYADSSMHADFVEENYGESACDLGYSPTACVAAWAAWDDDWMSCACYDFESTCTPEPCSDSCAALAAAVNAGCSEGDVYDLATPEMYFKTHLFYSEYGSAYILTSCDVGYEPNACDAAMGLYEASGQYMLAGEQCAPENNEGSCSAECTALVDAVKAACPGESWVPTSGWMAETDELIEWDPASTIFGVNFRAFTFAWEVCDASFQDEGTPNEETPVPATEDEGTPDEGTPDDGTPDDGTPDDGTPDEDAPDCLMFTTCVTDPVGCDAILALLAEGGCARAAYGEEVDGTAGCRAFFDAFVAAQGCVREEEFGLGSAGFRAGAGAAAAAMSAGALALI